jgi:hypothetical protein
MTRLRILLFRLRALLRSRQMDRDIDDEITSHLAEATDEYIRQGLSPDEARWAALRSFGGVTQAKEVYRQVRSFMWLADLARDLRHAVRTLRRSPGLSTTCISQRLAWTDVPFSGLFPLQQEFLWPCIVCMRTRVLRRAR